MYEPEDDMNYEEEESEEIPTEMWQESSWITISAFFEEKGKDFVFTKKCCKCNLQNNYCEKVRNSGVFT